MIRQPAVANQFYPGREADLKKDISKRYLPWYLLMPVICTQAMLLELFMP